MTAPIIEIQGLNAGYKDSPVLRDISLTVSAGEFTGILGPNGSGKTTLIRALSGVLPLTSGLVRIAGHDIRELSPKARAKHCATVAQKNPGLSGVRALSLVLMGRYPHVSFLGGYSDQDHRRAQEAMAETSSLHLQDRGSDTLSGGELQRVITAKALAQDTRLLLLDEAASNLDVARTLDLYELLRIRNASGLTILTVAHDLNLAALYCHRLVFLKNGSVAADGPTDEIFTSQTLSEIYETPLAVAAHPITGAPQAYLVPRA
ncbi:MAG: ABC transporter ATP-binding protein [Desulfomicrobium sp.]|nr:ABC transporter ATP-binding protein [Pseudomonadota bacterium]MBV1713623.1 ABC transporter ATP-binding protein [Desulfomicrobium sp.]MBU4572159.1 ABC transporter ATP-binding protein [Pseudomonadota bacterium]MBU4594137.1 ABC transporter ATP-binding protein [Pseudomonadota bacterium]MBV1720912.1 ABC transporter ATP-binding protein [Desulfomicrobium sp.]